MVGDSPRESYLVDEEPVLACKSIILQRIDEYSNSNLKSTSCKEASPENDPYTARFSGVENKENDKTRTAYVCTLNKEEKLMELVKEYHDCFDHMLSECFLTKQNRMDFILQRQQLIRWKLREMAIQDGGLLNDSIRREVWPIVVLGHEDNCVRLHRDYNDNQSSEGKYHEECDQIQLDVMRNSWRHLSSNMDRSDESELQFRKQRLCSFINRVLLEKSYLNNWTSDCFSNASTQIETAIRFPKETERNQQQQSENLHYYQGYHDVASIFLSVMSEGNQSKDKESSSSPSEKCRLTDFQPIKKGFSETVLPDILLRRVSNTHFIDYLQKDFKRLQAIMKLTFLPLIDQFDKELHDHLRYGCDIEEPNFIVSWLLTWFCHDILCKLNNRPKNDDADATYQTGVEIVKRLYDFFLVSHPTMPIYVSIALLLHPTNRNRIMYSTDADFAEVHAVVAQLPLALDCSRLGGHVRNRNLTNKTHEESDLQLHHDDSSFETDLVSEENVCDMVSLEEVIQMAVVYMNKIPPSQLPENARLYYSNDQSSAMECLDNLSMITLFQPIAVNGSALSVDRMWSPYLCKDHARKRSEVAYHEPKSKSQLFFNVSETTKLLDGTTTVRRYRGSHPNDTPVSDHLLTNIQFLDKNRASIAVIAAGFALGYELDAFSVSENSKIRSQRSFFSKSRRSAIGLLLSVVSIFVIWKFVICSRFKDNLENYINENSTLERVIYDINSSDMKCVQPFCTLDHSRGDMETVVDTILHKEALSTQVNNQQNETFHRHGYIGSPTSADVEQTVGLNLSNGMKPAMWNATNSRIDVEPAYETYDIRATITDVMRKIEDLNTHSSTLAKLQKSSSTLKFFCGESESRHEGKPGHAACYVAGEPGQLLCLRDGSQLCRPILSDGSIDLVDLAEDDVRSCESCQSQDTLYCPLEYGFCGSTIDTVLVCRRYEVSDTNFDLDADHFLRTETCVNSPSNQPHPYRIDPEVDPHNQICGCCDGFDPDIDTPGKCPDIPKRNSYFNKCCHPCRSQVPEAYQPCCCRWSDEYGCNADPTLVVKGGYKNCSREELNESIN